jgi:DeoR family transcriptional regulator, aga operon transcriptional repressor
VGLHRIARLDQVHAVITDEGISNEYRDGLQRLNIETIVAGSQA